MNNKINNLKEQNNNLNDLLIKLKQAEAEMIDRYNKPLNYNRDQIGLEEYNNLVKNIRLRITEIEKALIINADRLEQEENNAILENNKLIEMIDYFTTDEITSNDIYKLIKKASEQNNKIVYHNVDEYIKELPKHSFTNKHIYMKKGGALQHDKIMYIRNISILINNIMYNRNVLIEYLENTSDPEAGADAEAFRKEEIKFLKEIKVYIAVLQKIYNIQL